MSGSIVDVVIVGAGAAGLGAARAARELGLDFVVCEAMNRIGGRAFTDHDTFGFPWDAGCHWLHSASINPFRELADRYEFRYHRFGLPWRLFLGERWATEAEQEDFVVFEEEAYLAIVRAGEGELDVPVGSVIPRDTKRRATFEASIHAEWGVSIDQVSTLDLVRYRDTNEDWPVEDGYGALVARHARGLPVELNTPVETIDWSGPMARVATTKGMIEARAVIVTVSTNVLAAGLIDFRPALPDWKMDAAAAIPLGSANKIAFAVDRRFLGVDEPTGVVVPMGDQTISFRLGPYGRDLADGYLAGPLSVELEQAGDGAMVDAALQALAGALGSGFTRHVRKVRCSRWGVEPTILGAYAAAKPGRARFRADLGRAIDDRLFFAGEATSPDFFSTCHGADASGVAAARAVAAALGRAPAPN